MDGRCRPQSSVVSIYSLAICKRYVICLEQEALGLQWMGGYDLHFQRQVVSVECVVYNYRQATAPHRYLSTCTAPTSAIAVDHDICAHYCKIPIQLVAHNHPSCSSSEVPPPLLPPPPPPIERLSKDQYQPTADVCTNFLFDHFPWRTPYLVQVNATYPTKLARWISAFLTTMQLPLYVITAALGLLKRLNWCTSHDRKSGVVEKALAHELFVVACVIAQKTIMDHPRRSARNWVGGTYGQMNTRRIVLLEKEFLWCVGWGVHFGFEELRGVGIAYFERLRLRDEGFL
ncbi:hypothetical protein BXZ70DRAFT_72866 [Cristinia sonorae]|uniref:Uncharacterized protein n=1 Tax=Cristinia sonorae TaxID=1940300 RepID=A0A8K0UQL3_9AGAR|nr:hypothetical protein BXZ70DRAFT_72866 [Cristinia sonorae]